MKANSIQKNALELGKAIAEDGVSYLGLPTATAKWFLQKCMPKTFRPEYFISTKREIIDNCYFKHNYDWLFLQHGDRQIRLPVVVEISNSNCELSLNSLSVDFEDKTFVLDAELEAASKHFFKKYKQMLRLHRKTYYDGELARLKSYSKHNDSIKFTLQPVRYSTVCKTHMCIDAPLSNYQDTTYQDTLRCRIHSTNGLEPLKSSRMANALGINNLLFTADGELIMQRRSKKVIVFPNMLCPASSGDLEADDFKGARSTMEEVPILRETKEELQLHSPDLVPNSLVFLGLTRELIRGGKPELFFAARTKLGRSDVEKLYFGARDKWEASKIDFFPLGSNILSEKMKREDLFSLRNALDRLFNEHLQQMSLPLLSGISLWQRQLGIIPQ